MMTGILRLEKINHRIGLSIEYIGVAAFIFMMLITTIDVFSAKLFSSPMPGTIDYMELAQLISISFALSASIIAGRHVTVEFFMPLMPRTVQKIVEVLINLTCLFFFILLVWRLMAYGIELQERGEVSGTARLALYPFAMAAGVACLPACLVYLSLCLESILKVFKR